MLRRHALRSLAGLATLIATPLSPVWADQEGDEIYHLWETGKRSTVAVKEGKIELVFQNDALENEIQGALSWIRSAARAVELYFGRFPVDKVALLVQWRDGAGIGHGTSWGYGGSIVRVQLGRGTTHAQYADDWVLVHELIHVALPNLHERHLWLEEGSATYVEPVARVQAGLRRPEDTWQEFTHGMVRGLPDVGDEGLDRTHTWGRTYWGGALFYLLADIGTRRQTENRFGLQDALRAINRASHGNSSDWDVGQYLATGDRATGTAVLRELYDRMSESPIQTNLPELWRSLGVEAEGDMIHLDDTAKWAAIRRAIVQVAA